MIMSKCLNAVYFDESGNTEQGFKDKSQPCITFASHNFSENNCKIILKSHFLEIKRKKLNIQILVKRTS